MKSGNYKGKGAARCKKMAILCRELRKQEGQHPLTGQRAPPISG